MSQSPEFATTEAGGAQLQALHTLINCGWRYVTRSEADQWREGRRSLTFLETQTRADLTRINRIYFNDRAYPFSEPNIDAAVSRLADRIPEGVVRANERMTDDLTLGIALPQSIGATSREWPFKYIDWQDWRANTFQVTSEYTVTEPGGKSIRVDLVQFVNGIPLGVSEVKSSHVDAEQGVSQQIRNQKTDEGVPSLFYSAQLLIAANTHDPRYGTVGTPRKLWSPWKEREDKDEFVRSVVNRPLDTIEGKRITIDFAAHMKKHLIVGRTGNGDSSDCPTTFCTTKKGILGRVQKKLAIRFASVCHYKESRNHRSCLFRGSFLQSRASSKPRAV